MYLFACWSEEIIFVMLNSTEVVSLTLGYIVPVAGLEDVGGDGEMEVRVEMI
jgi:hypothetical protein